MAVRALAFLAQKNASKAVKIYLFIGFYVWSILVAEYLSLCSEISLLYDIFWNAYYLDFR